MRNIFIEFVFYLANYDLIILYIILYKVN